MSSQTKYHAALKKQYLKLTKVELIKLCKKRNIRGYKNRSKQSMADLLVIALTINKKTKKKKKKKKQQRRSLKKKHRIQNLPIAQKKQYLIYGYFHSAMMHPQTTMHLPQDLAALMIQYQGVILSLGKFDICPHRAKIDIINDGTAICRIKNGYERPSFGHQLNYIPYKYLHGSSKGYDTNKHEWKVTIKEHGAENGEAIGIISTMDYFKNKYDQFDMNGNKIAGCCYYIRKCVGSDGRKRLEFLSQEYTKYKVKVVRKKCGWIDGDVVGIELDCDEWRVKFSIGDDIVVDGGKVSRNLMYYMFVYSVSDGTRYELISQW